MADGRALTGDLKLSPTNAPGFANCCVLPTVAFCQLLRFGNSTVLLLVAFG